MADPELTEFADDDQFLRRVRFSSNFNKRGLLRWQTFKIKDAPMSWTFRDPTLATDEGVDEYHAYFSKIVEQKLPAVLWFSFFGLVERLNPPLIPKHDPAPEDDPKYGHLHCSTDVPRDEDHMRLMAKLVNQHLHAGIVRSYL